MKFISWNVNGIRACISKVFFDFMSSENPDFLCIQETKAQPEQVDLDVPGYKYVMNSAIKKGYSGTLIYYKEEPINIYFGLNDGKYNDEGRVITLEYPNFYLVTAYSPNSQEGLLRLDYRMNYEDDLRTYLTGLDKPVIFCGDLNVAHKEIDIKNPKANLRNAGFTIEERTKFSELLDSGFIDTFRYLNPDVIKYSWWSYRFQSRAKNIGWRIDYFVVSKELENKIKAADIKVDVLGSDHAPITLEMEF